MKFSFYACDHYKMATWRQKEFSITVNSAILFLQQLYRCLKSWTT